MRVKADGPGRWQRGRWRVEATLLRRHTAADGALEGPNIPWFYVDGMFPVVVSIEGVFTGVGRVITSARAPELPGEERSDPSTLTEELGAAFPQVGQDITRPARIEINGPVGWVGFHLAAPLEGGEDEISVFLVVSSQPEGG